MYCISPRPIRITMVLVKCRTFLGNHDYYWSPSWYNELCTINAGIECWNLFRSQKTYVIRCNLCNLIGSTQRGRHILAVLRNPPIVYSAGTCIPFSIKSGGTAGLIYVLKQRPCRSCQSITQHVCYFFLALTSPPKPTHFQLKSMK